MILSVKTTLSGPTFHLHWQPEEHHSALRGPEKFLHPDAAIQSDYWAVNPGESCAAFGLNDLLPEFWMARQRHETLLCGGFRSCCHAWNTAERCLWLIMTARNLVKREQVPNTVLEKKVLLPSVGWERSFTRKVKLLLFPQMNPFSSWTHADCGLFGFFPMSVSPWKRICIHTSVVQARAKSSSPEQKHPDTAPVWRVLVCKSLMQLEFIDNWRFWQIFYL